MDSQGYFLRDNMSWSFNARFFNHNFIEIDFTFYLDKRDFKSFFPGSIIFIYQEKSYMCS